MRRILLLGLGTLFLGACQSERPNLLLITLDTTRADRLGCYGDAEAISPTLDALAAEGLLFEHALAPSPLTLPSHASILTGCYPFTHGSRNNGMPPREDLPTVAESLLGAGYRTAAVLSSMVLGSEAGLARGFESYDTRFQAGGDLERGADLTTDAALEALDRMGSDPFFLWVHYFDPHHPYAPPAGYDTGDDYGGEIAFVDAQIRRVLDHLGDRRERTVVLVIADHGEAFGEHGETQHGLLVYDTTVRVPLILRIPGETPRRIATPVSGIDVAPTLLALAGIDVDTMEHALDLRSVARGRGRERALVTESMVPFYNHGAEPLAAVRMGSWKYVHAPRPELYDLAHDPQESMNVHAVQPERSVRMEATLAATHPLEWSRGVMPDAGADVDEKTRQMLASLGYVGYTGSERPERSSVRRADPKDVVEALARVRQGDRSAARGDHVAAELAYRRALEILPQDWKATWHLGELLLDQGRYEAAIETYGTARRADPRNLSVALGLGKALRMAGEADRALDELSAVLRAYPQHRTARVERALTLRDLGRFDEAERELRTLVEEKPNRGLQRLSEDVEKSSP